MFLFSLPAKVYGPVCGLVIITCLGVPFVSRTPQTVVGAVIASFLVIALMVAIAKHRVCTKIAPGITRQHIITLKGIITPRTASTIIRRLRYAMPGESIAVIIDSKGGDVASARSIIRAIKKCPADVRIIIGPRCMSSAFLVACSVPAASRFAVGGCVILIHGVTPGTTRKTTPSTLYDDAWYANLVTSANGDVDHSQANRWIADNLSKATSLDKPMLESVLATGGDLTFGANAALKNGLIGNII